MPQETATYRQDIVWAERKFAIYSQYLDTTLGSETEVQEGETRQSAKARLLKELEEDAERLRMEWRGKLGPLPEEAIKWQPLQQTQPSIIDINDEKIEIAIDNAGSIMELGALKLQFPLMEPKQIDQYNRKLKQLQP